MLRCTYNPKKKCWHNLLSPIRETQLDKIDKKEWTVMEISVGLEIGGSNMLEIWLEIWFKPGGGSHNTRVMGTPGALNMGTSQ